MGLKSIAVKHGWGHQFGAKVKDRLLEWATENKWPPQITKNDCLIVGHCHTQFYNRERQVLSTGTWHDVKRERSDLMGYLIVESKGKDDEIQLMRWEAL